MLAPPFAMRLLRLFIALLLGTVLLAQPVMAQSILRDAETEALFHDLALPLIKAAGLDPKNVRVVLVNDPEINAFATQGQDVYLNAGLVMAAKNANEVQGVVAHELGHVAAGDVLRGDQGIKQATGIMLLSLLLGAAAIAAGGGEAGAGILSAGQQAAVGKFLAFTRVQESGADESARRFMRTAGISGRGMISFFRTLQNQEYRLQIKPDEFASSHPLTADRIQLLSDQLPNDPAWNTPTPPALEARFQRVRAKLAGYLLEPKDTLIRYPASDTSIPARYARAYAYHKGAYPDKAVAEVDALLAQNASDPYYQELKGQILLESGKPAEALPLLRSAVQATNYQPLIATTFGHALLATENPANYSEAKGVLRAAIQRDNENPFAWYQLGVIYSSEGDQARASLATAERYLLEGQPRLANQHAALAARGLPTGSPDWLRAQDIALTTQSAVKGRRGQGQGR